MPNVRWLLALITRVHRWLYLRTGGRVGARAGRLRFLLLHHTGRRSGRRYTTPLLTLPDRSAESGAKGASAGRADRWVVVASNAGDDRDPAWWRNLQARPEAQVQMGSERVAVKARAAHGPERAELWARLLEYWPQYAAYERRTRREIPVVVLERRA